MPLPSFLLIGAPKAATTSLAQYLGQHPDIFMAVPKEPHFLAFDRMPPAYRGPGPHPDWFNVSTITDTKDYERLFAGAGAAKALGEASTGYLYLESAVEGIRRHVPRARLIAVLRNPVDRAYSHFVQEVQQGRETVTDFAQALALEPERIAQNWSPTHRYADVGRYADQISRYFHAFDRQRIRVLLYEDLTTDLTGALRGLLEFLEVDDRFEADLSKRLNQSGLPRNQIVQRLLLSQHPLKRLIPADMRQRLRAAVRRFNLKLPPGMAPEVRAALTHRFRDQVLRLQDLIDRDLTAWLAAP